jgi:hypothetical protein
VDNIKIDLREIGWGGMDWTDLAQDRDRWRALVNTVMNLRVPWAAPYLKRLVAGFPPRRSGFNPGSGQVGFVVDIVAPVQVFSEYFGFPCHSFHQWIALVNILMNLRFQKMLMNS